MTLDAEMTLEEFASLAEAWGGDMARWPADRRVRARRLLLASRDARRALEEASALDRLLADPDAASTAPADDALVDRIVGAARRTPRAVPRSAPEPAAAPVAARISAVRPARVVSAPASRRTSTFGRAEIGGGAALLAASMVLGIFVGGSRLADRAVPALEELTGITISSSVHSLALAAGEVDEDL